MCSFRLGSFNLVVLISEQKKGATSTCGTEEGECGGRLFRRERRLSLLLFLERHLLSLVVVDFVGTGLLVLQVLGNQILQVGLGLRLDR
jgi:hypothetical protein